MKTRKIAGTPADPTLPKTSITIDGTDYDLCFDLGALAEAEAALNAEGRDVNLLAALPTLNLSNTRLIFAAALRTFHPRISYDEAVSMVTLANVYLIAQAIQDAWKAALPEVKTGGNAEAAE